MKDQITGHKSRIDEIRLLIFRVMDVRFGVDMETIAEMCEPDQAKARKIDAVHIHDMLRFDVKRVDYRSPKVLIVKDGTGRLGVMIDQPETINFSVKLEDILLPPSLLKLVTPGSPIWGFVLKKSEVVMMLDPFKLLLLPSGNKKFGKPVSDHGCGTANAV